MTELPPDLEPDWIDRLVALGARLGMNEVRLRWKLMAWAEKSGSLRGKYRSAMAFATYEHKICPGCGQINDKEMQQCSSCGSELLARRWQVLSRLSTHTGVTLSHLLVLLFVAIFARVASLHGMEPTWQAMLTHGACHWASVAAGDWWRPVSALLLHWNLGHLIVNAIAMSWVGPKVEAVFGRGRTLFLFLVTGVGGNLTGAYLGTADVGAGASAGLFGILGASVGLGQKLGGSYGKGVRNEALLYIAIGIMCGGYLGWDHVTHLGGFVTGLVIGSLAIPTTERRAAPGRLDVTLGCGSIVALLAAALRATLG